MFANRVMIDVGWLDIEFVREWTNGPFLVRENDGTLLPERAMLPPHQP